MYAAVRINEIICIGCKKCIYACPDPNVLSFDEETRTVSADESRCKGCGLCVSECPKDAMSIY